MRTITNCLLAMAVAMLLTGRPAAAADPLQLALDLSDTGAAIGNKFSDLNMWTIDDTWTATAATQPKDHLRRAFPFVQRIQFMAATGGNEQRDLFKKPNDRSVLTDYDFDRLVVACRNTVAHGLKPMIKTGWVPLKLSAEPHISKDFATNVRPPADYDAYYAYIKALAETLKKSFPPEELRTWTWGVGVEYENRDWFEATDGKPETTRLEFFRLYDCTVAAIEDALGAGKVTIGAHCMAGKGFWDARDLLDHCATGENLRRGGKGTRLDYLSLSYYTKVPGFQGDRFVASVDALRNKARAVGLTKLKYGVDEGRVLLGWDNKVISPRETQHPMQAAGDAKLFQLMVEHDIDWFSSWSVTTEGTFGGVPIVSANLRNLAYRLNGSVLVRGQRQGLTAQTADEVGGVAGYDAATKTLRVLVYNLNPDRDAKGAEDLDISVSHARPAGGDALTLRAWPLDADHGNWWNAWQADVAARKMGPQSFKRSIWTIGLPRELLQPADVEFWKSRQQAYAALAEMKPTDSHPKAGPDNTVGWHVTLPPNGVLLYELSPVAPAK